MIILDTNILSEPLRPAPDRAVVDWLDAQDVESLYTTTISLAEMRYGIAALPAGKRRRRLGARFEEEVVPLLSERILAFDNRATTAYAHLRSDARRSGRAIGDFDALIAAIALSRDMTIATRDILPFTAVGVPVINPFDQAPPA